MRLSCRSPLSPDLSEKGNLTGSAACRSTRGVRAFRTSAHRDKNLYIRMKTGLIKRQPEVGPIEVPRVWKLNSRVSWWRWFIVTPSRYAQGRPSHGTVENGERRIPRIQNAHFYRAKRGLPKVECRSFTAMSAMRNAALNIRHGNRAPVVVRGRESCPQGEGEQFVSQYKRKKGV